MNTTRYHSYNQIEFFFSSTMVYDIVDIFFTKRMRVIPLDVRQHRKPPTAHKESRRCSAHVSEVSDRFEFFFRNIRSVNLANYELLCAR